METVGCNLGVIYLYYDRFDGSPVINPLDSTQLDNSSVYKDKPDFDECYYIDGNQNDNYSEQ